MYTTVVESVDRVFIYILGFSLVLLTLVTVSMIYFVIRYRRSRHPEAADIRSNLPVELVWTIVPTIIALSMFWFGWQSFTGLRTVPAGAVEISVTAMQYAWVFGYPNKKESEGLLMVPQGRAVKLNITSADVLHGLYIPAFRIKMDAVPNMKTYAWFYADRVGTYQIYCTQFCGVGHADMSATVRIVPEPEYRTWLESNK